MIRNYIKPVLAIFFIFYILFPIAADGSGNHDHEITIPEVLKEIRIEQNVSANGKISADKVSRDLLEKLGEAVMSQRFPDPKEHEYMDNMMGGEGSENLRIMHERMGYYYIRNGFQNNNRFWGSGMMGGEMMNNRGYMFNNRNGATSMGGFYPGHMGFVRPGFYGFGFGGIINIVILGLLITLVVFMFRKYSGNQNRESALDILKKRYARGEITKKEFETLKNEIK